MITRLLTALVLLAALAAGTSATTTAHAPPPESKVGGRVYAVPGDFLVTLASGRVAYVGVALLLGPGEDLGATAATGDPHVTLPLGAAAEQRVARVRATITSVLRDAPVAQLEDRLQRHRLLRTLRSALAREAHVHAREVVLTDVALR